LTATTTILPISTLFPYTTLFRSITNVRSSLMAVNIHITIIELNALHTKRQNLFQELDAVIHLLMEEILTFRMQGVEFDNGDMYRSEERVSRNAETISYAGFCLYI